MRLLSILLALLFFAGSTFAQSDIQKKTALTPAQEHFSDMRFGVFIHWGIYSMLGQGEWVMQNQDIHWQEYEKLASGFYPIDFNAKEWVSAIKNAGARYICITSRHHDGFSLWDTAQSDYNIVDATPFGRDVLKELAQECEKQGIQLHFYYSTLDWRREDYPRGRTGRECGRGPQQPIDNYFNFMYAQLTELLTQYGRIGCIWLDGHWDHEEDPVEFDWRYDTLYPLIKSLQSDCLIGNNHHLDPFEGEDIQIFERDVPGENKIGLTQGGVSDNLPLETCQTMNNSWGYRIKDQNYTSAPELIRYLAYTAGRNANLLLNVGPQPDGRIPAAALERLAIMGEWLSKNGESIYDTRATLVPPQPWGVVTHSKAVTKDGYPSTLYLHVFPKDLASSKSGVAVDGGIRIFIPCDGIPKVSSVVSLEDGTPIPFRRCQEGLFVTIPPAMLDDTPNCVIKVEIK